LRSVLRPLTTAAKIAALAALVAKSLVLFYIGRVTADLLIAEWPAHALILERAVMVALVIPLVFFIMKPFFAVVLPYRRSQDAE
jgi:hypothetical protein